MPPRYAKSPVRLWSITLKPGTSNIPCTNIIISFFCFSLRISYHGWRRRQTPTSSHPLYLENLRHHPTSFRRLTTAAAAISINPVHHQQRRPLNRNSTLLTTKIPPPLAMRLQTMALNHFQAQFPPPSRPPQSHLLRRRHQPLLLPGILLGSWVQFPLS